MTRLTQRGNSQRKEVTHLKTEKEIKKEIREIEEILKDKALKGDKSDWDYFTFRKDALMWALGEYDQGGNSNVRVSGMEKTR